MASFNKFKNVLMLAFDWILYGAACLVRLRPGTVEERGKALQNCSPEQLHTVPGFLAVPPIKNCSFPAGVAGHCQVTVAQPRFQQVDSSMNVSLPCSFSASGCSSPQPEVLWFRFLTSTHQGLCTPGCTDHQKYKVHSSGNNILLQIKDLTEDDSAVYICGIAFSDSSPLSKQTGDGTVLTVTGSGKQLSHGKLISMIIASTLLFLYSSAVLISFVVYKLKPKLQKKSGKDQTTENCKINSGRKIFQAIAQELQKQRYAQHQQQPEDLEDDTVYQNR